MAWRKKIHLDAIVAADRPIQRSLLLATIFAINAAVSCAVLFAAYRIEGSHHGVAWAIVSAILVLIPDVKQTVATALARVTANIIGALAGLLVVRYVGDGPASIILAVVIVSYICHILRLDLGLRTACVSVIIVMMSGTTDIGSTSIERFVSVLAGCATGVIAQLAALAIQKRITLWAGPRAADRPMEE